MLALEAQLTDWLERLAFVVASRQYFFTQLEPCCSRFKILPAIPMSSATLGALAGFVFVSARE